MKDRFRDWNLLHKSTATFLVALAVGVVARAFLVIDAGFELKQDRVLNTRAAAIWPWITEPENRTRWQGELIDIVSYRGDADESQSTRLLFWRRRGKRWQAVEQTTEVFGQRLYATIQESDIDLRWFRVELTPLGPCQTRVSLREVIQPTEYKERFWFFTRRDEAETRLTISLEALDRWVERTTPACELG